MKTNIGVSKGFILHFFAILSLTISTYGQSLTEVWKYKTKAEVIAAPLESKGTVFIGSIDGIFYALDSRDGSLKWSFETNGTISARALAIQQFIFFESANIFYLLDRDSGKQIWQYDPEIEPQSFVYQDIKYDYRIDPWDDIRSSAIFNKGVIYVGLGNGSILGLEVKNGNPVFEVKSDDNSPIRSTPFIDNKRLYFGDWNGLVYCYDFKGKEFIWKKKTYRGARPYPSFGGVVSEFILKDDLLFFGARNHMVNTLFAQTGEKEWTFSDPKRGWIVGHPVIDRDTLYIGGSDNYSMYAFHPATGAKLWQYNCGKNIYAKPIVTDKYVIFTAGSSYNPNEAGKLVVLNRYDGSLLTELETPKAAFSSPLLIEDKTIVFGCHDGFIRGVKLIN